MSDGGGGVITSAVRLQASEGHFGLNANDAKLNYEITVTPERHGEALLSKYDRHLMEFLPRRFFAFH